MDEPVVYEGTDLEAMSFAKNYHRWILKIFEPYFGTRLVEVGSGRGSVSELLLECRIDSLSLIEPSGEMYQLLMNRIGTLPTNVRVSSFNTRFQEVAEVIKATHMPDSIIYINVLEHISDDLGELKGAYETLEQGGRIFIFVPALKWLFGSFDNLVQHQRRYTRSELENRCKAAGFRIIESRYFDIAGILPWWVKYRIFKSTAMERGAVAFYDRFAVPLARAVEGVFHPPTGKNLILIAEKI